MNIPISIEYTNYYRKIITIKEKKDLDSIFFLKEINREDMYIVQKDDKSVTVIKKQDINERFMNQLNKTNELREKNKSIKKNVTIMMNSEIENIEIIRKILFLEDLIQQKKDEEIEDYEESIIHQKKDKEIEDYEGSIKDFYFQETLIHKKTFLDSSNSL